KLSPNCIDEIALWNVGESGATSLFLAGATSAKALGTLNCLACFVAKSINETSAILTALANDLDSVRHTILQNRAAIDYLLLAHGCENFDGMRCMDLNSRSIHQCIQELMDTTKKVTEDGRFFGLHHLLDGWGITGWLRRVLQTGLLILCVFL
ncbi:hypothetical protein N300_14673, partial [Calypte anna]